MWVSGLLPAGELCPSAHSSATRESREQLLAAEAQRRRELLITAENAENAENYVYQGSVSAARHFDRRHPFTRGLSHPDEREAYSRELFPKNRSAFSAFSQVESSSLRLCASAANHFSAISTDRVSQQRKPHNAHR